jgi:crotonobetainyl-CoA:carnitine CoA-transferase CaiB-like acyl-CoA transferase
MAEPLEGIRVLDWTQWQMGTVATAMLADLGASVVHIENRVTGDGGRGLMAGGALALPYGKSAYFECNNRGKKGMTLDLLKEKGREVVYRLVKNSDVFVHNFRQGVPERLGLDYETLCQHNPSLVYAAASGYGPKGPEATEPAFDLIGQARSGIMSMVGEPDMPPLLIQGGVADQMGAIMTAYGILAALLVRERLGIGQMVDVSHLGSMMAFQGLTIGLRLYHGQELAKPSRKRASNPLWNYYPVKDGEWLTLGMLQSDRYWPTLCKGLGIEHLEKDPRFEIAAKRYENCEELITIMDEIFITKSASEWMKTLKEAGDIVCTPVQTISDLIDDPQVLTNDYIVDGNHEVLGPVKVIGIPIQLSKTPGAVKCEAPELGQHTEEVLIEIGGYSWEEIAELREEEII